MNMDKANDYLNMAGHLSQSVIDFMEVQTMESEGEEYAHSPSVKLFTCLVCASLYYKLSVEQGLVKEEPETLRKIMHEMLDNFIEDPSIELSQTIKH